MPRTSKKYRKVPASTVIDGAGSGSVAVRVKNDAPTPKRQRVLSDNQEDHAGEDEDEVTEVDPDLLLDYLLGCLHSNTDLLDIFIDHLFNIPEVQTKSLIR